MTHQLCFPGYLISACDLFAAVEHVLERYGYHIHVVVSVDTAGDTQAQQVHTAETVLAGYRIAVGQDAAATGLTPGVYQVRPRMRVDARRYQILWGPIFVRV